MKKWLVPAGVGLLTVALSACGSLGTLQGGAAVLDYNGAQDALDAESDQGVTPILVFGNISGEGDAVCNNPSVNNTGTVWTGVKVDPPVEGTFQGVTIDITDGKYLAWTNNGDLEVAAVVMKGGENTFVYRYASPLDSDSGLRSPLNNGGKLPGISHYVLCLTEGTPDEEETGLLKLRKIYDFVVPGNEMVEEWKGQYPVSGQLNGEYDFPEPIFGGWPVQVTQVDENGVPISGGYDAKHYTLPEQSPDDGLYITVPVGYYKVTEYVPAETAGGGVWYSTGANKSDSEGNTDYEAGSYTVYVKVTADATKSTAPVARFFNVCAEPEVAPVSLAQAINVLPSKDSVYEFPYDYLGDISQAMNWECLPTDWVLPGAPSSN